MQSHHIAGVILKIYSYLYISNSARDLASTQFTPKRGWDTRSNNKSHTIQTGCTDTYCTAASNIWGYIDNILHRGLILIYKTLQKSLPRILQEHGTMKPDHLLLFSYSGVLSAISMIYILETGNTISCLRLSKGAN